MPSAANHSARSRFRHGPAGLLLAIGLLSGPACESTRKMAGHGQDLIENPGRGFLVRAPAGFGAVIGHIVAFPVSILLVPTTFFESTYVRNADQGDIYISPVKASYDYGHGVGAAVLGAPFDFVRMLFREPPPRAPGTVVEDPELPPTETDPKLDFMARSPVPPRRLEPGQSPAPPPLEAGETTPPNTEFPRPGEKPATGDPAKDPAVKDPAGKDPIAPITPTAPAPQGGGEPKASTGEPLRG